LSDEDKELEQLKKKRLEEMQKNISSKKKHSKIHTNTEATST